jgi:hypothetical protein
MSSTAWLVVAVIFAALAAYAWIKRELWLHRRRRQQRESKK